MDRDDASRRSARLWWYTGVGGVMAALAVALTVKGRVLWLVLNLALGAAMLWSFRYVARSKTPSGRTSKGRLARLDDRLMSRFERPRGRPLNRLERWLQQLDDRYAPDSYRPDQRD